MEPVNSRKRDIVIEIKQIVGCLCCDTEDMSRFIALVDDLDLNSHLTEDSSGHKSISNLTFGDAGYFVNKCSDIMTSRYVDLSLSKSTITKHYPGATMQPQLDLDGSELTVLFVFGNVDFPNDVLINFPNSLPTSHTLEIGDAVSFPSTLNEFAYFINNTSDDPIYTLTLYFNPLP
jgi:hypothetical protein